jgi:alkylation response protein AidB-like acyl-CoA dehydrogenase
MFGISMLGNTLLAIGTEEQKKHYLPRVLSGEDLWCQGFSEPAAGSDLGNLGCRAVLDGDEWIINGQKTWNTGGHMANHIFVLARTAPDEVKHRGITFLLVDMRQPGVEVRPLKDLSGNDHFCEVFFDGARTSADMVVGGRGNGWKTAMGTLGFERGTAFMAQQLRFAKEFANVRELAQLKGVADDPDIRQRLARAYGELEIMRWSGLRNVTRFIKGGQPGPGADLAQ